MQQVQLQAELEKRSFPGRHLANAEVRGFRTGALQELRHLRMVSAAYYPDRMEREPMNHIQCCSFTNEKALIVNVNERSVAAEDVRKISSNVSST